MKILLNGKPTQISNAAQLNTIIKNFCKDSRHIIAQVNGTIIKRPQWSKCTLKKDDTVELVSIVGGG